MHLYRRKQNVIDNPQSNLPANQLQSFFHNRDLHIQLTSSVECFALWPKQKPSLQVIFFNQTVYGIWLISLHFIDMRQCNCKSLVKNFPWRRCTIRMSTQLNAFLSLQPRETGRTDELFKCFVNRHPWDVKYLITGVLLWPLTINFTLAPFTLFY